MKLAMYATWCLAGFCVLFYAASWLYFTYIEIPGLDRFLGDASAINGRGDEVTADTERDDAAGFPAKTVIRLKPAHDWFARNLLTAESRDYLVGFKWRGDDRLVVTFDFGCDAKFTDLVHNLGPIRIIYRFDRQTSLADHGYSSFPHDAPRPPCR